MITEGVLSTYKLYEDYVGCKINIVGYGTLDIEGVQDIDGVLLSITRYHPIYLFVAHKPCIDTQSVTEDMYLLHDGVFNDTRASGRCLFVSKITESDGIIYTSHNGMFHVKPIAGGLLV
jgi:hypothetical protein